jgi:hypothetical protein
VSAGRDPETNADLCQNVALTPTARRPCPNVDQMVTCSTFAVAIQ